MGNTPQTNLRLSPIIKDAAVAAAVARGLSLARLVEMALSAYLETLPDDTGGMVPHDPILPRLEAIERRLSALEGDTGGIPNSTAPPPPQTEGGTKSDSALRRDWKKAGGKDVVGPLPDWAASQGWERVGDARGNKSVWRKL